MWRGGGTEIIRSYWKIGGCSGECIVLDIRCFHEIHNFAVDVSFLHSSSQFCISVYSHLSGPSLLSSTYCCLILALWKYVPVAVVSSRGVKSVDFSVCVLSNWPFLWQSISVNAVRTTCIIQKERNEITAGCHLSSRLLIVSTPILSGWLFPKLRECQETSVTFRKHCALQWEDFCAPRYFRDSSPHGPRRLLS